MPRRRKKDDPTANRTHQIGVRVSDKELDLLSRAAGRIPLATYVRDAALAVAREQLKTIEDRIAEFVTSHDREVRPRYEEMRATDGEAAAARFLRITEESKQNMIASIRRIFGNNALPTEGSSEAEKED